VRAYTRRIGLAIALLASLSPGLAAAAPVVTVGLDLGPVGITLGRPLAPAPGWMWVEGGWAIGPLGARVYTPGYWAPPVVLHQPVVVHRPVVVTRRVAVRPAVVHHVVAPATRHAVVVRR
jgi:hypothetical protein